MRGDEAIFTVIIIISTLIVTTVTKYCTTQRDDTLYIYPSANNCSSFIVCYHNEEIEMSCLQSSLFMFSEERVCLKECSAVNDAKMRSRAETEVAKSTIYEYAKDYALFPAANKPEYTIICPSRGITRAAIPQECREFIDCDDGVGTRRRCDIESKFSPSLYKCVPEDESDCEVGMERIKGSYVRECRSKKGNSALVFPSENCSGFLKCANHMAWTVTCAQNTSFSREKGSCEWNEEVKCEQ